jgi:hypothetical protein
MIGGMEDEERERRQREWSEYREQRRREWEAWRAEEKENGIDNREKQHTDVNGTMSIGDIGN